MKKFILAITLVMTSTSALAISPVQEARVKSFFNDMKPIYVVAEACKTEGRFELLEEVMNLGYMTAGAEMEIERNLVDMYWMVADEHGRYSAKNLRIIKANPDRADVVKACDAMQAEVTEAVKAFNK